MIIYKYICTVWYILPITDVEDLQDMEHLDSSSDNSPGSLPSIPPPKRRIRTKLGTITSNENSQANTMETSTANKDQHAASIRELHR